MSEAIVNYALGRQPEFERAFQELREGWGAAFPSFVAFVYAYTGVVDAAFEWLDRVTPEGPMALQFTYWPLFSELHDDPRWRAYRERMGQSEDELAADFLSFVRELGFRGVQLGPQGATSPGNTSPYDATLFSRNPLSLALGPLTRPEWAELLPAEDLARLVASRPGSRERVPHGWIHTAIAPVCTSVWDRFRSAWVEGRT